MLVFLDGLHRGLSLRRDICCSCRFAPCRNIRATSCTCSESHCALAVRRPILANRVVNLQNASYSISESMTLIIVPDCLKNHGNEPPRLSNPPKSVIAPIRLKKCIELPLIPLKKCNKPLFIRLKKCYEPPSIRLKKCNEEKDEGYK